jgi:RNA polymerase sigma-70 factor (ECF subfamily)
MTTEAVRGFDLDSVERLRPELVGYCYRMLGSVFEADDAVQETMVRAWQARASFEGRASVRTWVYRVATNVCVDILRGRGRRAVPMDLGPSTTAAALEDPRPVARPWLTPMPDRGDPADVLVTRETIRLAFVAALQHLPARQRSVLILRDVLDWPAAEVADLLDATVASVNSALQRARATLATRDVTSGHELTAADRDLLADYVAAFERYDIATLVTLLHDDAIQSMPPYGFWLRGAATIGEFLLGPGAECRGSRLVAVSANGGPAFAQYRRDGAGGYRPWSLQLLEVRGGRVAELHTFLDPRLFEAFGLPASL